MPNQDKNASTDLQGTSYVYDFGTSPETRTAVSQKVRVKAPTYGAGKALRQMGVLGNFAPTNSRGHDVIRGIGFGDKVAEIVPSVTAEITAGFERALLYLCNLWQATGYAGGVDGPVRSLSHHRWPFDLEEQLVFSTLADYDLNAANVGFSGQGFQQGVKSIRFPDVTKTGKGFPQNLGHSAIITMYECCWFTETSRTYNRDSAAITENGNCVISDVHDFGSIYGEFLATGNDPTIGELGSIRFAQNANNTQATGLGIV